MKIKNLVLTIAFSISSINYSYAEATSAMDKLHVFLQERSAQKAQKEMVQGLSERYGNNIGKDIAKKGAERLAIRGAKKIVFLPLSTAKLAYKHPLLTATAIAGGVGVYINTVGYAVGYFADDPSGLDDYLESHKDKINDFSEKTLNRMEFSPTQEKRDKYRGLARLLHIAVDYEDDKRDLMEKTAEEQENVENSKSFKDILLQVRSKADSYDDEYNKKNKNTCTSSENLRMIKESPPLFYINSMANPKIAFLTKNDGKLTLNNLDQYSYLKNKASLVNSDHIPSYKALELYFKRKTRGNVNKYNLKSNATAINITYLMHLDGSRTHGRKNGMVKNNYMAEKDSMDLREATLKDIASLIDYADKNLSASETMRLSSRLFLLYKRNKELCLFY